jgi:hypothetical protein
MPPTPTEQVVLFPQPLSNGHRGRRALALLCLGGSLGSLGWFFLREPIVKRLNPSGKPAVAAKPVTAARPATAPPSTPSPDPELQPQPPARVATTAAIADSGVYAYDNSGYDSAAVLLRRALRVKGPDSLDATGRVRALTFLGAAELLRGRRDSATAAFRQLLTLSPTRPPDPAVFPVRVLEFYHGLRSQQQGVARVASTAAGVALTIVALKPHELSVGVGQNGRPTTFQLFRGVVSDSVVVLWNGLTPTGGEVKPGSYELVLVAFPSDGSSRRSVRFPVLVERLNATGLLHARAPGAPMSADPSRGNAGQFLP